jgi:outer membrane protein assembly complex protein YaeT
MCGIQTIRRRLLVYGALIGILGGISITVIHTGVVRRFVLVRIRLQLEHSHGLLLEASDLDYDLFQSHYELKDVVLRSGGLADLPAPFRAKRVTIGIPIWDLVRGSFDAAQIRIEGLSLRVVTLSSGRQNLPARSGASGCPQLRGPAISITDADISVEDEPDGIAMEAQAVNAFGGSDVSARTYRVAVESSGGQLQWRDLRFPLDHVRLQSTMVGCAFSIESVRIASGDSRVEIAGALNTSPPSIEATANFDIDSTSLGRASATVRPAGRLRGQLKANGPLDGLQLAMDLHLSHLAIGNVPVQRPVLDAIYDTSNGELQIRSLSADLFEGSMRAKGVLWSGTNPGRSEVQLELTGANSHLVGVAFGAFGIPSIPVELQMIASSTGMDWRQGRTSGTIRSGSAKIGFNAALHQTQMHVLIDTSVRNNAQMHGDVVLDLNNQSIAGRVSGAVGSLALLGVQVGNTLRRPAGIVARAGVDGSLNWTSTLNGTLRAPLASLQLHGSRLCFKNWQAVELDVDTDYAPKQITIRRANISWQGQQITTKGEIGGTSSNASLNLQASLTSPSVAPVLQQLGVTVPVEADLSGDIRIAGTISHPSAKGTLHSDKVVVFREPLSNVSVEGSWNDDTLTVSRLTAKQDHGSDAPGQVEVRGSLQPANGRVTGSVQGNNLFPPEPQPGGLAITGTFNLTAKADGTFTDPNLQADLNGRNVRAGQIPLGNMSARLNTSAQQAKMRLEVPDLNTEATATVGIGDRWPFEFSIDGKKTHLATTPAASFDVEVRGSGSLKTPEASRATATIQNFRLATKGPEITSDGPIELSYTAGRIRAERMALQAGESTLQLKGEIPVRGEGTPGSIAVAGRLHLESLPQLLPTLATSQVTGLAELNATLRGTATALQPDGSITIRDGSFQNARLPFPLQDISGKVNIEKGVIRLDELTCKAGSGTFKAGGSLPLRLLSKVFSAPAANLDQPARFAATVDKVQLSAGNGKHRSTAIFSVEMAAEALTLSLPSLHGTIDFDELEINSGGRGFRQNTPIRITVSDSVVRLQHLDLKGPNGSLQASGSMGLTGTFPLQADMTGTADLAALSPFLSPVETTGTVRLDLHIKGTRSDPLTTGYVEFKQATLMLPHPLVQAEDVEMRADFEGDRVTLKNLGGRLNGGSITGGGDLHLGGGGIRTANLFLKGRDVFAQIPTGLKTINSMDVKLASRGERLILEGQIEVQEGFFEAALDLRSLSPNELEGAGRSLETKTASSHAVGLDVRILTKRPMEMNNNLGRISGTADLRLTGTLDRVGLRGSLRLEPDGRLYFGDRIYYVESGTVRFLDAPQITPELDIDAYTRASSYTIHLGLSGTPGDITSTFTSDPPLSREDAISVLLTGKTVAENRGVDVRSLEAFSVATGAMNAALSSRLRNTFGVSRVSIQPSALIAAESNPGTRLTVTQDFTQAFRIMYSTNLGDSSDQIWVSEYDLSRSLTTRLVKQSDNTYRGEFRHDVRFGRAQHSETINAVRAAKPMVTALTFVGETPFAEDVLAKKFKVKAGKEYDAVKVRKGAERLNNFLVKKGYLESRVGLDRHENAHGIDLTVRIELGPVIEMTFRGTKLPRGEKSKLRNLWHAGLSDRQRSLEVNDTCLDYLARKGYLRAHADTDIANQGNRKLVHFDMTPGIRYRDVKVMTQGAAPERVEQIRELIDKRRLEVGSDRDPSLLTDAITRYYQQRGYLVVKVEPPVFDLDDERRTGRIVVPITEGPVFHLGSVEFSGNQALTAELLRAGLPVEAGQVFEAARLDPAVSAIRLKYGKLGYRNARIAYAIGRNDERASVDLRFTVTENKQTAIRSVEITGNRQTKVKFAQGRLLIAGGQVADTTKIRDSVTSLSRTGAYAAANIEVQVAPEAPDLKNPAKASVSDPNTEPANVVVRLAEPKPFRLLYGGLYDNGSGPGFIFDLQNRNTLGPGRTLGLRARYDSDTKEARIYLTQPYWGLKRVSTTVSTYFTNLVPYGQNYPTAKAGIGFEQDWPSRGKFLLSYGVRFEKQRAWLPVNGMEVRTPAVFAAPLTFTISREARDSFLDATHGSFTSHSFEFAPDALGTQFPYIRYYLQYFKYFPLTRPRPVPYGETATRSRLVFATGTRIGLQKGLNPRNVVLTDRFYAGGGTTVRGFEQDSLGPKLPNGAPIGGNAVFVFNNELRYPLFWVLDAVSFVDIGNVFPQVSDFRFGDLRKAGGFGLRVRNPFVVLRFDYGFKLDRQHGENVGAFFFSIGQAF